MKCEECKAGGKGLHRSLPRLQLWRVTWGSERRMKKDGVLLPPAIHIIVFYTNTHAPIILNFMSCFVNSSNAFYFAACNYSLGGKKGGREREKDSVRTRF